jgi:hypothetical protein
LPAPLQEEETLNPPTASMAAAVARYADLDLPPSNPRDEGRSIPG